MRSVDINYAALTFILIGVDEAIARVFHDFAQPGPGTDANYSFSFLAQVRDNVAEIAIACCQHEDLHIRHLDPRLHHLDHHRDVRPVLPLPRWDLDELKTIRGQTTLVRAHATVRPISKGLAYNRLALLNGNLDELRCSPVFQEV